MRIGINALFLIPGGVGGTEIYLRNLLAAFAAAPRSHQFVVFLNRQTGPDLLPAHPAFLPVQTGVNAVSRPARILYEQTVFPWKAARAGIDVMFNPGFTAPLLLPCPNVTLIHDLQHHHHPEYFKPADLLAWRLLVWSAATFSARILTVSAASTADVIDVYNVPAAKAHTAEPGVDPALFELSHSPEPLILCVSTLHPHKNIERLIDAFALFFPRHPEYSLVLAGMRGFHADAVEARIRHHGLQAKITITGWIPRPEILALYARAQFAVFPSTFEGFGIPVAEALAAGVPLITSNIRPMTDTAQDAALLFAPTDTQALLHAMEQYAADPALREANAARGRRLAARYTSHRTAQTTLNVLEQAYEDRTR
jgi:glycosyltransferase involved in cell wall biosynthesis